MHNDFNCTNKTFAAFQSLFHLEHLIINSLKAPPPLGLGWGPERLNALYLIFLKWYYSV